MNECEVCRAWLTGSPRLKEGDIFFEGEDICWACLDRRRRAVAYDPNGLLDDLAWDLAWLGVIEFPEEDLDAKSETQEIYRRALEWSKA